MLPRTKTISNIAIIFKTKLNWNDSISKYASSRTAPQNKQKAKNVDAQMNILFLNFTPRSSKQSLN